MKTFEKGIVTIETLQLIGLGFNHAQPISLYTCVKMEKMS